MAENGVALKQYQECIEAHPSVRNLLAGRTGVFLVVSNINAQIMERIQEFILKNVKFCGFAEENPKMRKTQNGSACKRRPSAPEGERNGTVRA